MNLKKNWVAFQTIIVKEVVRFLRVWTQTILPSAITMALYFIIFGHLMGPRIGDLNGIPYIQYIAPGLIMMSVITNAYSNVTSSFFLAKFQRSIEELLVSPTPNYLILSGFVMGAVFRGLIVGFVVTLISALFMHISVHHFWLMFLIVFLSALLFSLAGFINGVFAKKFDDIAIIPTFILTPLTYLGGVFYSLNILPPLWKTLSLFNPILYMVSAFRYGVLGVSDVSVSAAVIIIVAMILILSVWALYLLNKGIGIRT